MLGAVIYTSRATNAPRPFFLPTRAFMNKALIRSCYREVAVFYQSELRTLRLDVNFYQSIMHSGFRRADSTAAAEQWEVLRLWLKKPELKRRDSLFFHVFCSVAVVLHDLLFCELAKTKETKIIIAMTLNGIEVCCWAWLGGWEQYIYRSEAILSGLGPSRHTYSFLDRDLLKIEKLVNSYVVQNNRSSLCKYN